MQTAPNIALLQETLERAAENFSRGELEEADSLCSRVLDAVPGESNALHILGIIRLRQNDPATAVSLLEKAHKRARGNVEITANLGAALRAAGKPAKAAKLLRKAVVNAPQNPAVHFNYANALADEGEAASAERHYRRTLQLVADHAGARQRLADLLFARDQWDEAITLYRSLVGDGHPNAEVFNAIGAIHAGRGETIKAEHAFREALATRPDNPDALANLGNALTLQYRLEEARDCYERAVSALPACPDTRANFGNMLRQVGEIDAAEAQYRAAIALESEHCDARAGLATLCLAAGRYEEGWRHYMYRESVRGAVALCRARLPFELDGRSVTVLADQGLGDEIFFLRFVPELRRRAATVSYRPEPRLSGMLGRAGIVDRLLPADRDADGDFVVAVGDLPYLTGADEAAAPPASIAIPPLPGRLDAVVGRLSDFGPPPYVGVTWRAGTPNRRRLLFKEIPAAVLARALSGVRGTVVAVQRGASSSELEDFAARLGRPVLDLSDANDDLEDLLALTAALDDYVAVSNTAVHLRAAAGRTSRLLVPAPPEFRWMAAGDESPWFPGSRVYRQAPDGDWTAACAALAAGLSGGEAAPAAAPGKA